LSIRIIWEELVLFKYISDHTVKDRPLPEDILNN